MFRYGRALIENTQKEPHVGWPGFLVINTQSSHSLTMHSALDNQSGFWNRKYPLSFPRTTVQIGWLQRVGKMQQLICTTQKFVSDAGVSVRVFEPKQYILNI